MNMEQRARDLVECYKNREPLPVELEIAIEFLRTERRLALEKAIKHLRQQAIREGIKSWDYAADNLAALLEKNGN